MPDLPRSHLALYALAAMAIVALGWRQLGDAGPGAAPRPPGPEPAAIRLEAGTGSRPFVHVAGAVRRPGVYRLRSGARVADAVRRAGGARPGADLTAVNLAAEVQDGRQVLVPRRAAAPPAAVPGAEAGAGAAAPAPPLNLNTATLEQLDELDGIGPETARKILEHRQAAGGFGAVDELAEVPGIGEKRLATLRELVTV